MLTFPDRLGHEATRLQAVPANISIAAEQAAWVAGLFQMPPSRGRLFPSFPVPFCAYAIYATLVPVELPSFPESAFRQRYRLLKLRLALPQSAIL